MRPTAARGKSPRGAPPARPTQRAPLQDRAPPRSIVVEPVQGPLSPRELSVCIKSATSVAELQGYVTQRAAAMDAAHVSAALARLVKFPGAGTAGGPAAVGDLMQQLMHLLSEPQPPARTPRYQSLDTRGQCNTLWAIVKGRGEGHPACALLLARLCQDGHRVVGGCNPLDLTNVVWAVATASEREGTGVGAFSRSGDLVGALVGRALDTLHLFEPPQFSQLIWSLATLEHYDEGLMDTVATCVCGGGMAGASPQAWVNLVWGYATLRHSAPALFACGVAGMTPLVREFNAQHVSNGMWAYSAVSLDSLVAIVNVLEEQAMDCLPVCNAQNLANMAHALALLTAAEVLVNSKGRLGKAVLAEAALRDVSSYCDVHLRQLFQLIMEEEAVGRAVDDAQGACVSQLHVEGEQAWKRVPPGVRLPMSVSKVVTLVQSMGLDARVRQLSPCGLFFADIEVTLPGGKVGDGRGVQSAAGGAARVVAIEVRTPKSCMRNAAVLPTGSARWRYRRLVISYGGAVALVDMTDDGWHNDSAAALDRCRARLSKQLSVL